MDIELHPSRIVLDPPVHTARGVIGERPAMIVEITDDDGHQGRGEAAPLPGWSSASFDQVTADLDRWARAAATAGSHGARGISAEARAAIDTAEWMLRASQSGRPLGDLLGAPPTTGEVPVNALVSALEPAAVAAATRAAIADGYRTLKMKIGVAGDRLRLEAVREALEPDTIVRLDLNSALALDDACDLVEFAARLFEDRLDYIEDAGRSLEDLEIIGARTSAPLAVDELVRTATDLHRSLGIEQVVAVVVKPTLIGGISPTLGVAAGAGEAGVDVVVSSTYDGVVGLGAWCHLAAAVGSSRAHGLGTATLLVDPEAAALLPRGGRVRLP